MFFYKTKYIRNGGISQTPDAYMNYKQEKIGATITVPEDQIADTWTFKGWSTNESYTNLENVLTKAQIPTTATENATYYALFEKDVTVTRYEYNGKTDTQTGKAYRDYTNEEHGYPIELSSLDGATLPDNCTKLGWKKDSSVAASSADEEVGNSVTLVSNTNYYMIYTKTIYIEYKDSDGNALADVVESTSGTAYTNYNLSSTIAGTAPKLNSKIPTKDGFEFLGWNTSSEQTSATYSTTDCTNQKEITGRTTDLQLFAVWESVAKPVDPNSSSTVNKKITASSPAGVTEWLPFYNDGTYNYVISYDYVPYNATYMSSSNTKLAKGSSDYYIYWSSVPSSTYSLVSTWWRKSQANANTSDNAKCAASLLNTSWWSSYVITTYGDQAIGSASLEMYVDAYNARYGAGKLNYTQGTYGVNYSGTPGTSDRAFCITETSKCYCFWLASPYGYMNGGDIPNMRYEGYFAWDNYYDGKFGLRPIVRLKSGVKIVEKPDGTYEFSN